MNQFQFTNDMVAEAIYYSQIHNISFQNALDHIAASFYTPYKDNSSNSSNPPNAPRRRTHHATLNNSLAPRTLDF